MKDLQKKLDNTKVNEYVKGHPFFKGVPLHEFEELISECSIRVFHSNEVIYQASQPREGLLLLLEGSAEVFIHEENEERFEVLEVVQKNELIGFASLADFLGVAKSQKYEDMVRVRAVEDAEALFIPYSVISKRWNDDGVRDYMIQQVSIRLKDIYTSLAEQVKLSRSLESNRFVVRVQDVMATPPITVPIESTVQEIAAKMAAHKTSSVLIMEQDELKGLITKTDVVERVIAQSKPYDLRAEYVMTKKPYTISRFDYYYAALSKMLLSGIKHLPVVDEETNKVVGVVSLGDLLRKKNESMMKTIQQVEHIDEENLPRVKTAIYQVLETLLHDNVPMLHTLDVITNLYDRLVDRCVELAVSSLRKKLGMEPPVDFCFYMMGSSGRGEQFMLTDQDHFLVYDDVEEEQRGQVDEYFAKLGEEIVSFLETAGYARCIGKMMSSELNWRGSTTRWQERLRQWMLQATNDNILLAQNFFSYRLLYGSRDLHKTFEDKIKETLERSKIFMYRMAQVEKEHQVPSLEHPIRSLFKLERKQVDMKKEILFPFHHSLQILSIAHGTVGGTPLERIQHLVENHVISENFAHDIKTAFNEVMMIYVKQKWQQHKRGEETSSVLKFVHLTTREKDDLMLTLKTFRELQSQMLADFSI